MNTSSNKISSSELRGLHLANSLEMAASKPDKDSSSREQILKRSYIKFGPGNKIDLTSRKKEAASFKEVTKIVQEALNNQDIDKATRQDILNNYTIVKENFEKKELRWLRFLLFSSMKNKQIIEAKNVIASGIKDKEGNKWEGSYNENYKFIKGKITFSNDDITWEGSYNEEGKLNGFGRIIDKKTGLISIGRFENGKLQNPAKIINIKTGEMQKGNFENGHLTDGDSINLKDELYQQLPTNKPSPPNEAKPLYFSWDEEKNVGVMIRKGDICHSGANIIVNAANRDLRIGGGVSGSIHEAAGHHTIFPDSEGFKKLMEDKEKWKLANSQKDGLMDVGTDFVLTSSGDLEKNGVEKILHVAGPDVRNDEYQQSHWDEMLKAAYKTCFEQIEQFASGKDQDKEAVRIAIPVISGKIFGIDPKDSIKYVLEARGEFIKNRAPNSKPIILEFYTYSDADTDLYINSFSKDFNYPNIVEIFDARAKKEI